MRVEPFSNRGSWIGWFNTNRLAGPLCRARNHQPDQPELTPRSEAPDIGCGLGRGAGCVRVRVLCSVLGLGTPQDGTHHYDNHDTSSFAGVAVALGCCGCCGRGDVGCWEPGSSQCWVV
jgi:hypothetical protein